MVLILYQLYQLLLQQSNVGPGLGDTIGPNGNFAEISNNSKWILSFAMILGRLELFAILVLFIPSFWRKF